MDLRHSHCKHHFTDEQHIVFSRHNVPKPTLRVQELCESRGGRPGLSVLMSLTVSVDVKQHWTVLRHWSQFVPNMSKTKTGDKTIQNKTNKQKYKNKASWLIRRKKPILRTAAMRNLLEGYSLRVGYTEVGLYLDLSLLCLTSLWCPLAFTKCHHRTLKSSAGSLSAVNRYVRSIFFPFFLSVGPYWIATSLFLLHPIPFKLCAAGHDNVRGLCSLTKLCRFKSQYFIYFSSISLTRPLEWRYSQHALRANISLAQIVQWLAVDAKV